ncbi:putative aldehyde dehydrogenase [Wilcoxina mikolae CBS 423.85]|nr:putative aldehyde dehydrogenase [Wilcoxina mikolae CBS 423.85]
MSSNPLLMTFSTTPVDSIPAIHEQLTKTYLSGKTRDVEFRKIQLRKLYYAVKDNSMRMVAAVKQDLNKPGGEAMMVEVGWLEKDITYALQNLDKWMADETPETSFLYKLMKPRLKKEPIGTVLIIGAFNYPFQLTLSPLVGAIAAGCTAIIKPSEMSPYSAAVMVRILEQALDPDSYAIVNGGVEETTELLKHKWDKIMYTGNGTVARIVSAAAAKHLTPVILELGGLNPVFITTKGDAKLAAKRIAWAKVHNAGQICLSPNYVLMEPGVEAAFLEGFSQAIGQFFPNGTKDKENLGRIVNERHFKRIMGLLESSKGTVIFGGNADLTDRWIEPTLVKVNSLDDALLHEEIFGPVLPYYIVQGGLQEMVGIMRSVGDCPLGLYAFTKDKKEQEFILSSTRSGGVTFNDAMFHACIQTVPFGGVGESGTGVYRGKHTFETFTHKRPIVTQPSWIEGQLAFRYPPYTSKSVKKFQQMQRIPTPNFDRNGKLLYGGFFWRIMLLGAATPKAGILRLLLAVLGAYFLKVMGRK